MTTATRIFKGMNPETRKSIIDQIVNVQGHKSPRTKEMKDYDKIRGINRPFSGSQNLKPALFDYCVRQHL